MWSRVKWVILWSLWAARVVRQPTPPVLTTSGWVRGSISRTGTHAFYLGIPYATLPARFQAPGPEPIFEGIFEAIEENVHCRQPIYLRGPVTSGKDNCTTLNIYTPLDTCPGQSLPVMVFLHGGGFFQRSASRMIYGPEYLVTKGVILVTVNYRLNIQGFLCLGIKENPGNAGIKDQVAALRWVQKNIRAFGGDPDNVTLFGESAGAASVSLHLLSPMSKGLFHKAITQSGSSLSSFSIQYDPIAAANQLAKAMGFISRDPHELYNFFINQTNSDLIVNRALRKKGTVVWSEILYAPCIEKPIDGEEAFLTDSPYNILKKGDHTKVPMIIGTNKLEGSHIMTLEDDKRLSDIEFEKGFPSDLTFPSDAIRKKVAKDAQKIYMGGDEIAVKTKAKLAKFYGEPYFNYPVLEETELLLRTSNQSIYQYLFIYEGRRNVLRAHLPPELRVESGATHADELFYLFSQVWLPSIFETNMIDRMSTMWTNFAKYGDPTPPGSDILPIRWPQVTPEDKRILVIDDQVSTLPLWHNKNLIFWRDIYSKYRRVK